MSELCNETYLKYYLFCFIIILISGFIYLITFVKNQRELRNSKLTNRLKKMHIRSNHEISILRCEHFYVHIFQLLFKRWKRSDVWKNKSKSIKLDLISENKLIEHGRVELHCIRHTLGIYCSSEILNSKIQRKNISLNIIKADVEILR